MRRWMLLLSLLVAGMQVPAGAMQAAAPQRVLFVGNSLTYVGNLPATFAALANANDQRVHSAMIVQGGATLEQRVADGSVRQALASYRPAVLVLQERGGELLCGAGEAACQASRQAVQALAAAGRQSGARVLLLGSYQAHPRASAAIVEAERAAALQAGIGYVEISESLRRLSTGAGALAWYDADGMHPGPALTLLDAMQLYRALFGVPPARGFEVAAPVYAVRSGLHAELRDADAPAPLPAVTAQGTRYTDALVMQLNALLDGERR